MVEYNAVFSEEFGLSLLYLVNEENAGDFFMYVESDATFAPYEEINISDSITIALLSDVTDVVLPEEYQATSVMLNDYEFPAWQTEDADGFCILYALNNHGEKSLYQLDNSEGTYQRFVAPEVNHEFADDSLIGKLSSFLENHLDYVILGTGLGFLLFILIIIILSVKLYNRNAELDELYDEYGIGEEEDTKDDVLLDIEDEYDEDEEDDEVDEPEVEVEFFVQESMKEIFAEEAAKETADKVVDEPSIQVEKELKEDVVEETLGEALEKQNTEKKEQVEFFDDDEIFENFSMDFIDLDD